MQIRQRRGAVVGVIIALALLMGMFVSLGMHAPAALANYPTGHDNTTNPAHMLSWTHSDPNTLDDPGFGTASSNYYYLKAYAAGSTVFCEVYTGGNWDIALETSSKVVLTELKTSGAGGRVYITNGVTGNLYMCRIADIGNQPLRDYAELNSGPAGNTTTSDCGGPGPVWDPNFNEAPMEPAPTSGMPTNGCSNPTTVKYAAGDPRLGVPPEQWGDLGSNAGNPTYSFTTEGSCDITAGTFFGSQGSNGTLTIEDASGAVVNGVKWGAETPNPQTMNQEFVGTDAGVQPAGSYKVKFTGPSNGHEIYFICMGPQFAIVTPPVLPPAQQSPTPTGSKHHSDHDRDDR